MKKNILDHNHTLKLLYHEYHCLKDKYDMLKGNQSRNKSSDRQSKQTKTSVTNDSISKVLSARSIFKGPEVRAVSPTELRKIKVILCRSIQTKTDLGQVGSDIGNWKNMMVKKRNEKKSETFKSEGKLSRSNSFSEPEKYYRDCREKYREYYFEKRKSESQKQRICPSNHAPQISIYFGFTPRFMRSIDRGKHPFIERSRKLFTPRFILPPAPSGLQLLLAHGLENTI